MTRCVVIRHIGIRWDCFREEEEESEEGLKVAMIFWFFFWGGDFQMVGGLRFQRREYCVIQPASNLQKSLIS